jgi:HEPN domain-containing protein
VAYVPIYRKDFKVLAQLRAEEAGVLLAAGKQEGAYYLAGYAVECALKACIAKKTRTSQFPPDRAYIERIYSHRLDDLMKLAGIEEHLDKYAKVNRAFAANWNTVKDWTEQSRYKTSGLNGKDMYNAVAGKHGVLRWIKLRW